MFWEEIGNGTRNELATGLREYDPLIPEGSRGYLKLNTSTPVHPGLVSAFESALKFARIPEVNVTYDNHALNIFWKKEFPWLVAIVGVILSLLIILAIILTTWQLFREAPNIASGTIGAITIIGIGMVALAGIILLRRGET
ncbi:hypothetical protein KKE60_04625 [Patescibacteria group bacterium]|nr:hypothetical protein [Patescibacteria group bacterium]